MTPDGMMLRLRAIHEVPLSKNVIADILTADGGRVQVEVSRRSIVDGRIGIGCPIGRRTDGALLVKLPSEVVSGGPQFGAPRVWVPEGSVVLAADKGATDAS